MQGWNKTGDAEVPLCVSSPPALVPSEKAETLPFPKIQVHCRACSRGRGWAQAGSLRDCAWEWMVTNKEQSDAAYGHGISLQIHVLDKMVMVLRF